MQRCLHVKSSEVQHINIEDENPMIISVGIQVITFSYNIGDYKKTKISTIAKTEKTNLHVLLEL